MFAGKKTFCYSRVEKEVACAGCQNEHTFFFHILIKPTSVNQINTTSIWLKLWCRYYAAIYLFTTVETEKRLFTHAQNSRQSVMLELKESYNIKDLLLEP
jgi:hypothetical protein